MSGSRRFSFRAGWCLAVAILGIPNFQAVAESTANFPRERSSFNADWRFIKGDPAGTGQELDYAAIKASVEATGNEFTTKVAVTNPAGNSGADISYVQPGFDDSAWRKLDLPHDWGIEGPFKKDAPGETGKLPFAGIGWYRKHFQIPPSDVGRKFFLEVDGAMSYANVWLNGHYVGGWPYGYSSWCVDLTPYVKLGVENVMAVRLDNPPDSSRWYPGGGIYRNVWLLKTSPLHVGHWGTYVTTPEINPTNATAQVRVQVDNNTASDATVSVKNEIYELNARDEIGRRVANSATSTLRVVARETRSIETQIKIKNPKLWSVENPKRYVVVTFIEQDKKLVDRYETPFGIRAIKFDAGHGFFLNDKRVRLNGVCEHADLGVLGTVVNSRALERQIELLKEMGCNAIRTSHNPPAPELLDLCDRLGMLVMDESFDCWRKGKRANDYHLLFDDWHEKDWRAELRRDRNHPSVILWSTGNEVPDQGTPDGPVIAAELTRIAHEEDPTRPATAACDYVSSGFNGFQTNVDVFGYNYKPFEYAKVHQSNDNLPIFGSETASCISSRGEYFFPVGTNTNSGQSNFQITSYDVIAPYWATTPDTEFKGQDENPFVAGEFVWTGFDYLGEPSPYNGDHDPSRSSYFGIIDLAGFRKDRFYLYQSRWRPDFPMAHLVPQCWNWPDRVGQVTPVHVYTSGDEAELFLNGKSLGRKKTEPYKYRLIWDDLLYQSGELKVVTYKNGKSWATDVVRTAGPAAKLKLEADRKTITTGGRDLCFVTVVVQDKNNSVVPQAKNEIHFDISGAGEIVGTDNGDPTDLTSFQSHDRKAFNGLALVVIRPVRQTGSIFLKVTAPGLISSELRIRTEE